MANICLIDDEKALNQILKIYLEREGHKIVSYFNMQDIYNHVEKTEFYDLYIIDIMLQDGSGTEILKRIKEHSPDKPVILISARGESINRVLGFEMGCDDYLPKPFLPMELCYRVSKLLKKSDYTKKQDIISFSCYKLNRTERTLWNDNNNKIDITSKEYDIIEYFINHPNTAISRECLLDKIWSSDYFGYYRVVDNHIKNIRKKLPKFVIETIYGYGYRCNL